MIKDRQQYITIDKFIIQKIEAFLYSTHFKQPRSTGTAKNGIIMSGMGTDPGEIVLTILKGNLPIKTEAFLVTPTKYIAIQMSSDKEKKKHQ